MLIKDDQSMQRPGFINVTEESPDISPSPEPHLNAEPIRIRDSRGILTLTKALKSADKAWVVWILRGWVAHNQAHKKGFRDGHYWTFSPLERWQQKYFEWLSVKQLSTIMAQLVEKGVIIRTRRNVHCCYWYRVDENVLAGLCTLLPSMDSLISQTAELKDKRAELESQTSDQSTQSAEHKTVVIKQENLKQEKRKQKQTTTAPDEREIETEIDPQTAVAVVAVPHPTTSRDVESGEHCLDGEALTAKHDAHDGEPFAVKATANDSTATAPLSKVPQKVLSAADDQLRADLIRFTILPHVASRLIRDHGEVDTRYVLEHARASGRLGPGFVVKELDTKEWGVLAMRDVQPHAPVSAMDEPEGYGPIALAAWREANRAKSPSMPLRGVASAQAYKPVNPRIDPAYVNRNEEGSAELAAMLFGVQSVQKDLQPNTLDEARREAMNRENERMAAEDRERTAAQMSDSTGHLTQTLISATPLEPEFA